MLLYIVIYTLFNKNPPFKKKNIVKIHFILILLFIFSINQIYLFKFENFFIKNYNLVLIKENYFYNINYIFVKNFYTNSYENIKYNLNFLINFKYNIDINNFFKNIFEKIILFNNKIIYEIYNYNFQQVVQPNNSFIFLLFVYFLYIFLNFFKKKKSILI
jgi:hypothetical protein